MPYGLYISAEGANAQAKRLEVLSNNLANVDTTAFKRDLAVFQARYAEATERGLDRPGSGSPNDIGGGVRLQSTQTDYSMGPLKSTSRPTDMAIEGDGFFAVRKGTQEFLTRAGDFQFDSNNQLITGEGYPVLNDSGAPIIVDPNEGPWTVTRDGAIAQNGSLNFLKMVQPQSKGDLVKAGENLYWPLSTAQPIDPTQRRVKSGFLEGSGVKPTLEMMELIESSRAFEANTNMIKHQDAMLGTLISRVLKDG